MKATECHLQQEHPPQGKRAPFEQLAAKDLALGLFTFVLLGSHASEFAYRPVDDAPMLRIRVSFGGVMS